MATETHIGLTASLLLVMRILVSLAPLQCSVLTHLLSVVLHFDLRRGLLLPGSEFVANLAALETFAQG
jgi:hypothetical protein